MSLGKGIITFIIGIILSTVVAVAFNDGGLASATAICYVGAIIVALFYDHNKIFAQQIPNVNPENPLVLTKMPYSENKSLK